MRISRAERKKMRASAALLPEPGNEVVKQLLDHADEMDRTLVSLWRDVKPLLEAALAEHKQAMSEVFSAVEQKIADEYGDLGI